MIDPKSVCLFIPGNLKKFKLDLFERIGRRIINLGGAVVHGDINKLINLCDHKDLIPIIGCQPESTQPILDWKTAGKPWIYWDRGYARRVFATWLPRGENGGYYRWHVGSFQLQQLNNVPADRWNALQIEVGEWRRDGKHIVVAAPTPTYEKFHRIESWTEKILRSLARITTRQIVVRDKESKRSLQSDIEGAHCLVSHGSIAAVEAVICGCPVFVDSSSAAALVGLTDLNRIEKPIYPDRTQWLYSLAYSQFNETELVDGTLWKLIK